MSISTTLLRFRKVALVTNLLTTLACIQAIPAVAGEISPWRQATCQQSGSGEQLTLVISFSQSAAQATPAAATRVLNFHFKSLSATTELGKTTIAWQNMGSIDTTLASAIHPEFKQPGAWLHVAV